MKRETAEKRIWSAIRKCDLLDTQEKQKKMFDLIWSDYKSFENEEGDYYNSTQNLNYAIAIWLNDGDQVIKNFIEEK